MHRPISFDLKSLCLAYAEGTLTPFEVVTEAQRRIHQRGDDHV